ncbi:hypothetical protein ACTDI4_17980 [Mesorhizobium sp. PUT5]|uniref:hypothetical protein n=1 Tax=Mesorhizobium sp. PUT5 TaxID=3454629 RepID=UPI003FA46A92
MDLAAIKPNTSKVEIIHPGSGDPTGLVIEVMSQESPAVRKILRRQTDRMIKRRGKKMTAEQIEEDAIERLAASVVGWEWKGNAAFGGKKLDCTPENVATVLGVSWIKGQVQEAVADEAEFFTA